MADTAISWSDKTWNPTSGCDRISPGCDNCYALKMASRLKKIGLAKYQTDGDPRTSGPGFGVAVHDVELTTPLKWRKPRKVFVNSMSDLFHARVPVEFIARVWVTMVRAPQHSYQILTKRPERMARIVGNTFDGGQRLLEALTDENEAQVFYGVEWPLPNVWLGTSIESADYLRRADELRQVTAAVRFLSLEPLLGALPTLDLTGIDWVIVGGESGPDRRPMNLAWLTDIVDLCRESKVPVWVKQDVAFRSGLPGRIPDDYWIQEFPQQRTESQ